MAHITSRTQKSTGILFKEGMKVRGWDHGDKHRGTSEHPTQVEGTINTFYEAGYASDKNCTVQLTLTKPYNYLGYSDHGIGSTRSIWFDTMELVTAPLDLSRPLAHRSGKPVEVVPTGDADRPYSAKVNELLLTFDQYGQFYPGHEQPIDLVNT